MAAEELARVCIEIGGGVLESAGGEVELRRTVKPGRDGWYRLRPGIGLWIGLALLQIGLMICVALALLSIYSTLGSLVEAVILVMTALFAAGFYRTWLACCRRIRWKDDELKIVPRVMREIERTFADVARLDGPRGFMRWYEIEFADGQRCCFSSRLRGTPQFLAHLQALGGAPSARGPSRRREDCRWPLAVKTQHGNYGAAGSS